MRHSYLFRIFRMRSTQGQRHFQLASRRAQWNHQFQPRRGRDVRPRKSAVGTSPGIFLSLPRSIPAWISRAWA